MNNDEWMIWMDDQSINKWMNDEWYDIIIWI